MITAKLIVIVIYVILGVIYATIAYLQKFSLLEHMDKDQAFITRKALTNPFYFFAHFVLCSAFWPVIFITDILSGAELLIFLAVIAEQQKSK